jgi:GRIP domain
VLHAFAVMKVHIFQTIREELRKVQSSAALLERQRNPGVGYWSNSSTDIRTSISSDPPSRVASPRPASPAPAINDEEINLEYLRNVILQFLEHKEMRVSDTHTGVFLTDIFLTAKPCEGVVYHSAIHATGNAEVDREGVIQQCYTGASRGKTLVLEDPIDYSTYTSSFHNRLTALNRCKTSVLSRNLARFECPSRNSQGIVFRVAFPLIKSVVFLHPHRMSFRSLWQWLSLCRLLLSKEHDVHDSTTVETDLSS